MFCPKCGNQIEGMPNICPICNQNISEDVQMLRKSEQPDVYNFGNAGNNQQGSTYQNNVYQNNTWGNYNTSTFVPPVVPPPVPPKPPKPKKPPKTNLTMPIIALILAIAFLVSSVLGTVLTNVNVAKASDATGDAFIGDEKTDDKTQSNQPNYDASKITKPEISTGALDDLIPDSAGAGIARNEIATIESAISIAESEVAVKYPEITEDSVYYYISKVNSVARDFYYDDYIEDYEVNSDCIIFELKDGGYYIYAPHVVGYDAGSSSDAVVKVSTYQPFLTKGHYGSGYEQYASYTENAAERIASEFDTYLFKNDGSAGDFNHDDGEVNLESVMKLGEYGVVLWHGHGTYSYDHGPLLFLGDKRTETLDAKYYSLFKNGTILWSKDGYVIGREFIKNYVPDDSLKNTVLYLGTCKSGYDSTLAQAFLDKGAEAVYTATYNISTSYDAKMMKSIAEALTTTNSDGTYYSVYDALEYAKNANGNYDTDGEYNAQIKLYAKNYSSYGGSYGSSYGSGYSYDSTYSLDWYKDYVVCDKDIVLLLDTSGSMGYNGGVAMEQTKIAATRFVEEVIDDSARVALVTFDSDSKVINDFSVRDTVVQANINNLIAGGGTNMDAGLQNAEQLLDSSEAKKKIIVLMSDGIPEHGVRRGDDLIAYADTIKDKGVDIYTLGFFQSLDTVEKVAEGEAMLKGIASDGMDYTVNTPEDLTPFFEDIAANISGQKYIYIEIACPVDVIVKRNGEELCSKEDDLSTHTSFGSLSFQQVDEENTSEDISEQKKILRLKDGVEYDIVIEGNGNGSMDYTIRFMDENGKYTDTREFSGINITRNTVVETVASSLRDSTVVAVDEDGDGSIDKLYEAHPNGSGAIVDETLHSVLFCMDFVFGALFLCSILLLVLRIRNRRKASEFEEPIEESVEF